MRARTTVYKMSVYNIRILLFHRHRIDYYFPQHSATYIRYVTADVSGALDIICPSTKKETSRGYSRVKGSPVINNRFLPAPVYAMPESPVTYPR